MPTPIRMLTMCLVVLGAGGCSKTTMIVDEHGVVNAVTEAPTFRWRKTLIKETQKAVECTCERLRNSTLVEPVSSSSEQNSTATNSSGDTLSKQFKDIKAVVVSRFVSWNPHGNSPVCSVDELPGMTKQSEKRSKPVPSPFS